MNEQLRPSTLPKLAACSCYQNSKEPPGPAAERGTLMDGAFRSIMAGKDVIGEISEEDLNAVLWAVDTLKALSGSDQILTMEEECKIQIDELGRAGTADAVVPTKSMLADLKSGQIRNYKEQMQAYALGLMREFWVQEWTCHLLFCDQREVVTHKFKYEECALAITGIVHDATDPERTPTLCEYCEWCALATTCSLRVESAIEPLGCAIAPERTDLFDLILNDPDKLGDFLVKCKILDKFRDRAEDKARGLLDAGIDIPGWRLGKGRTSEFVDARKVYEHRETLGLGNIVESYGSMSGAKFRKLWEQNAPDKPLPEEVISKKVSNPILNQI